MIDVAVAIIMRTGRPQDRTAVLLCQRKPSARYPLKWEFPGGKVEPGEDALACLRRELREELGIEAVVGRRFHQQTYTYADSGTFDVSYFLVHEFSGPIVNNVFESFRWVPVRDLAGYDILEGNREVTEMLIRTHAHP